MVEACKYGLKCYRKRPEHFVNFTHPDNHPMVAKLGMKRKLTDTSNTQTTKIAKIEKNQPKSPETRKSGLFLTKLEIGCPLPQEKSKKIFSKVF